jgi:membrane protease YdiL (CAAX protease family)
MKDIFVSDLIKLFLLKKIEVVGYKPKKITKDLISFFFISLIINILCFLPLFILKVKLPAENIKVILPYEIIFVAPFVEEMLFRILQKKGRINYFIFISFLFFFLMMKFDFIKDKLVYLIFLFLFFVILYKSIRDKNYEYNIYNERTTLLLVILLSFLFGISHLLNFGTNLSFLILLAYFFSKFLGGIILSTIRLRYGIIISLFFHIFLNGFIYIMK